MSSEKIEVLYDMSPPPIQVSEEKEEVFTEDQLRAMAISALKVICNSYGILVDNNIVDKYMLVDQMIASRKLKIVAKHSLKG